jgi:hypothetical protein
MAIDPNLKAKVEHALRSACQPDPTPVIELEDVPPTRWPARFYRAASARCPRRSVRTGSGCT